jgi:phage host-nuclease inhibitor protein Gam
MSNEQKVLHDEIDDHLYYIGDLVKRIARIEADVEKQIAEIRKQYQAKIETLQETLAMDEKTLITCLKKNKAELFNKAEKVTLPHGIVIHTTEARLSLPKNAVEAIESLGWNEAIKIAKSVDREMVEKWPIEKIIAIGGDKKPKEKFEYELREAQGLRVKG